MKFRDQKLLTGWMKFLAFAMAFLWSACAVSVIFWDFGIISKSMILIGLIIIGFLLIEMYLNDAYLAYEIETEEDYADAEKKLLDITMDMRNHANDVRTTHKEKMRFHRLMFRELAAIAKAMDEYKKKQAESYDSVNE